jgi:hypothetical protein
LTVALAEGGVSSRPLRCSFVGCTTPAYCRGWCDGHYQQQRAGKQLTPIRKQRKGWSEEDRFWDQVDVRDINGCWEWVGAAGNNRGTFTQGSGRGKTRTILAHRWAYTFFHPEEDIEGVTIHHKCANSVCVREDHLQAVTHINNVAEMNERQGYLRKIARLERRVAELEAQLEGRT